MVKSVKKFKNIIVFENVKVIILLPALFVFTVTFNLFLLSQVHPFLQVCVDFAGDKNQVLSDI